MRQISLTHNKHLQMKKESSVSKKINEQKP